MPVKVVTASEIATMLGIERQKQLLGCNEGGSCMAELAGALDVDAVIAGSLARTESKGWVLSLKVIDARTTATIASYSTRVATDDALYDFFGETAGVLANELIRRRPELARATPGKRRHWAWIPTGAMAVVAGGLGAMFFAMGKTDYGRLSDPMATIPGITTEDHLNAYVRSGRQREEAGVGLIVTAAVLAVAAAVFFLVLE